MSDEDLFRMTETPVGKEIRETLRTAVPEPTVFDAEEGTLLACSRCGDTNLTRSARIVGTQWGYFEVTMDKQVRFENEDFDYDPGDLEPVDDEVTCTNCDRTFKVEDLAVSGREE